MFRRIVWLLACLFCLSPLCVRAEGTPAAGSKPSAIRSIGIYHCYTGMPAEAIPFFQACGYNTYQRWDLGWTLWPAKHEHYYADMAQDVERLQRAGFKAYVILSINMIQRQPGEPEGFRESTFDPADKRLMHERLEYIATTVRKLKRADGFTIGAGDPGGHLQATPTQVVEATRQIAALITREAPKAVINVNTWGIAAWDKFPSPFTVVCWEKEVQLSRMLIRRPDIAGPHVGIEFPLHNYYRSLARKCYVDAGKRPELFPTAAEVAALRQRGVQRLWGWPYFVTDECDDGFSPGTAGMTQSETRYIKQIVETGRRLELNGMIANAMASNIFAESLNLYAFGRFCKDPSATPEQVILEFAGFISEPETAAELTQVIRFIENRSTWQAGMPAQYRLPNFDVAPLKSAHDAYNRLNKVAIRKRCPLPMLKPPAAYIEKLKERLRILAKTEHEPGVKL
jgi:hypothetical protein